VPSMLFISILLLLSTAIAFIPGAHNARKVSILQKDVTTMYSTIEDAGVLRVEPEEMFWITPEGLSIEVLAKESTLVIQKQPRIERIFGSVVKLFRKITKNATPEVKSQQKPPILFIHGSFHAAWCFAENYLDFFSSRGHHSFAVSLRGTSITGMPPLDPGEVVRIEQHVSDIKSALLSLKSSMSDRAGGMDTPNPIIVSHSFGGLIVMKLLEDEQIRKNISGACFLCSVPPSGNGPMIKRFIKTKFLSSLKIVWGFVFKAVSIDLPNCRELFFDKSVPSADISK
jgi:pimeloyl-ACP methyl ester carboxylesterase